MAFAFPENVVKSAPCENWTIFEGYVCPDALQGMRSQRDQYSNNLHSEYWSHAGGNDRIKQIKRTLQEIIDTYGRLLPS